MKITILETTKESGTKNASEESESEAKAKGKAGTKEESKCEAEEAQHKAKQTFEEESCRTETKITGRSKIIGDKVEFGLCYVT